MSDREAELAALRTRASIEEAKRQAAVQRGDRQAAADATEELSRLYSSAQDIERGNTA